MKAKKAFTIAALFADHMPTAPQWKPGEALPSTLKLLKLGDNPSNKGTFRVTQERLDGLSAFQKSKGREHVAIDLEHSTLPGSPSYIASQEPRPIAARKGQVVVTDDQCIALTAIDWLEDAAKTAANYADISPAVIYVADKFGAGIHEVLGLHSAGLVRNGALFDVAFCSADDLTPMADDDDAQAADESEDNVFEYAVINALISKGLLKTGANMLDLAALIVRIIESEAAEPAGLSADDLKKVEGVAGTAVKPLQDQIAALTASDTLRRKEHLCAMARVDGKVIPLTAEVIAALSVDALDAQLKALKPGTVPLHQNTRTTGLNADETAGGVLTENRKKMAAMVGVDPAKVTWS